jgi:hypothetical protein
MKIASRFAARFLQCRTDGYLRGRPVQTNPNIAEAQVSTNRRRFLETAAANAAAIAIMPAAAFAAANADAPPAAPPSAEWDLSWTDRVKGKHRAVFDTTEPESGDGPWRAHMWTAQMMDVLKAVPADVTPIIVLRHHAIVLAMQQSFWDKYDIGTKKKVTSPMNDQPTNRNPVLLDEKDGIPPSMAGAALPRQIAAGAIVLACNLALQQCAGLIAESEKISADEAHARALGYLIPGVIIQPSGVFAVTRAQEAGASYVRAN